MNTTINTCGPTPTTPTLRLKASLPESFQLPVHLTPTGMHPVSSGEEPCFLELLLEESNNKSRLPNLTSEGHSQIRKRNYSVFDYGRTRERDHERSRKSQ